MQAHLGGGRDLLDVGAYPLGEADVTGVDVVDQLQAIDLQVILLAQADASLYKAKAMGRNRTWPDPDREDGAAP